MFVFKNHKDACVTFFRWLFRSTITFNLRMFKLGFDTFALDVYFLDEG